MSEDHVATGMSSADRALHAVVSELEALLRGDGETHWADWMQRVITQLEQGDPGAPESVLRAYGGMGRSMMLRWAWITATATSSGAQTRVNSMSAWMHCAVAPGNWRGRSGMPPPGTR